MANDPFAGYQEVSSEEEPTDPFAGYQEVAPADHQENGSYWKNVGTNAVDELKGMAVGVGQALSNYVQTGQMLPMLPQDQLNLVKGVAQGVVAPVKEAGQLVQSVAERGASVLPRSVQNILPNDFAKQNFSETPTGQNFEKAPINTALNLAAIPGMAEAGIKGAMALPKISDAAAGVIGIPKEALQNFIENPNVLKTAPEGTQIVDQLHQGIAQLDGQINRLHDELQRAISDKDYTKAFATGIKITPLQEANDVLKERFLSPDVDAGNPSILRGTETPSVKALASLPSQDVGAQRALDVLKQNATSLEPGTKTSIDINKQVNDYLTKEAMTGKLGETNPWNPKPPPSVVEQARNLLVKTAGGSAGMMGVGTYVGSQLGGIPGAVIGAGLGTLTGAAIGNLAQPIAQAALKMGIKTIASPVWGPILKLGAVGKTGQAALQGILSTHQQLSDNVPAYKKAFADYTQQGKPESNQTSSARGKNNG